MLFPSVSEFRSDLFGMDSWRWPNFTPEELSCKCQGRYCLGEYWHDTEFLDALQRLRSTIGEPFVINSAHRCHEHNRAVGGARNSMHRQIAVDVDLSAISDREKLYWHAMHEGFTGIGRYKTFIHLDRRGYTARWWGEGARGYWR